jgi:diketogulonate reductase-like aldo/keto reductase
MDKIGYGTYRLKGTECYNCCLMAIANGYRTIDTAILYKNHNEIKRAINDSIKNLGIKRSDLFIISKIHKKDQKNESVYEACLNIIEELGLTYIDLILLHEPIEDKIIKSWSDLIKVKDNKLTRFIGTSNFNEKYLLIILNNFTEKPYSNQIEISLFGQNKNLILFCQNNGIIVQAHSCLNLVQQKYEQLNFTTTTTQINQLINNHNMQLTDLIIVWLLNNGIHIVIKTINDDHMKQNLNCLNKQIDINNDLISKLNENYYFYKKFYEQN